jgi:serine/threonine protein kinase
MIQCPKCSVENPPDNKFCGSCGEELSSLSQAPTVAAPEGEAAPSPAQSPHVGRIVSSDSVPAGGFTPGTILADRYRIIGLLGRGGMGEVYRADDLKLGQPVALKFLPPALAQDSVRRERFFAEVRITRQLSHPNICRVYDIGEVDGRHFLSMEYIDGEDLASLMKRIGHLSNEKALDIARQLVAGLSVAHERGVLHRDLKPANIMLDGHGRVRITDFGLAIAVGDESQAEEIAGTPAYMAPEQLAGKGATVRSDIYSLGLILYEIYTGKKAFKAKTLAELREQKETQTPRAPSELRDGIDPVVERVIQRCMEKDPSARPASVAQLAQALPGGDPPAAAIAAGETPSPEMIAASGSKEGLKPWIAWGFLAFIIIGSLSILAANNRVFLYRRIPLEKSPGELVVLSRQFLEKAGYPADLAHSAHGFVHNLDLLQYIEKSDKTTELWENLNSKAILFWYRQSPQRLQPKVTQVSLNRFYQGSRIAPDNPPLQYPEEILVMLDTEGRLVSFRAVPNEKLSTAESTMEARWEVFFSEAGLELSQWPSTGSQFIPPFYADNVIVREGSISNQLEIPFRIETASYKGKVVSFEIRHPERREVILGFREIIQAVGLSLLIITALLGGLVFARRNIRLGRGDRRNAKRLALFILGLAVVSWIFSIPQISPVALFLSPYVAFICWIFYMAIEPYVRRQWPQILVSWTRLFSGNWRDPLVARDMLIGCAFGVAIQFINTFFYFKIPSWLGYMELKPPQIVLSILDSTIGTRFFISALSEELIEALFICFLLVSFLVITTFLLRNKKAAIVACILLLTLTSAIGANYWSLAIGLVMGALYFFTLIRFGILAVTLGSLANSIFLNFPMSLEVSTWYAKYGFAALAILAAIVLYAFYYSLGGRPIFGTPRLDD